MSRQLWFTSCIIWRILPAWCQRINLPHDPVRKAGSNDPRVANDTRTARYLCLFQTSTNLTTEKDTKTASDSVPRFVCIYTEAVRQTVHLKGAHLLIVLLQRRMMGVVMARRTFHSILTVDGSMDSDARAMQVKRVEEQTKPPRTSFINCVPIT